MKCDDWEEHREGRCEKHTPTEKGAGASCGRGEICGKGLTCSFGAASSWSRYVQRVCYDKATRLKVGDKCEKDETDIDDRTRQPHEGYPFPNCFIPPAKDENEDLKNALKCLPKGNQLVCQDEARLFEYCSAKENIVCEKGLVCSPTMSICLGEDEVIEGQAVLA